MKSPVQKAMVESLANILRPIVRLMLFCGLGYAEFVTVAKSVFVHVVSAEYGIRGRPTNASRVAALTGLSRKAISRIRADTRSNQYSSDSDVSPVNRVLHHWIHDPEFSEVPGKPKTLSAEGKHSFASLVRRYAGDIPPGALKTELCRTGAVSESSTKTLTLLRKYNSPTNLDDAYIRNMAFSLANLGATLVHNARVVSREEAAGDVQRQRFERCVFAEHLSESALQDFQVWARLEGGSFADKADHWIRNHESLPNVRPNERPGAAGVGIFFFVVD